MAASAGQLLIGVKGKYYIFLFFLNALSDDR